MRVFNTLVSGVDEALKAAGLPMATDPESVTADIKRGAKLGRTAPGTGHDNYLVGVVVHCTIEAPSYWWPEFGRYHFTKPVEMDDFPEIVSSMSKMHRLCKMDLVKQCTEDVDERAIALLQEKLDKFNETQAREDFEAVLANTPMGLQLAATIVTNYRQLKTMYLQRETHRQRMWREVMCPWMLGLPHFTELTGCAI